MNNEVLNSMAPTFKNPAFWVFIAGLILAVIFITSTVKN